MVAGELAYYNEIDPFCCKWLGNLMREGLIPKGDIDDRDIREVRATELVRYEQCHFFAGIAGWPYALDLAEWKGPVWTGSCPCQPYSNAGRRQGNDDPRNLWPEFHRLIAERRPPTVFGEQVASKAGREWLAGVRADLETLGYAVGAADLCAAGVSAPHIRQRLWWVGNAGESRLSPPQRQAAMRAWWTDEGGATAQPGRPQSHWIDCADGKKRRIEPALEPLVNGFPGRVGRLRAYGNAIVPQVAAEFIASVI